MEAHRKGILLLHDIQPATALAFPEILSELKARGYKIVHVVPATADRPKTVTTPEQWVARGAPPEQKVWPRVVSTNTKALSNSEPKLAVPSAASLGLSAPLAPVTSIALVPNFERPQLREGDVPLPPVLPWPRRSFVAPADTQVFPAPAAQTMRYARIFQMPGTEKKKVAAAKPKDPTAATANHRHDRIGPRPLTVRPACHRGAAAAFADPAEFHALRRPVRPFPRSQDKAPGNARRLVFGVTTPVTMSGRQTCRYGAVERTRTSTGCPASTSS